MRTTALSWMRRAKALEGGKELDNMTAAELKELVAALEVRIPPCVVSLWFYVTELHADWIAAIEGCAVAEGGY